MNIVCSSGRTPLGTAAQMGNMAILQILLDASSVPATLSENMYKQEQGNHHLKHRSKKNRCDYSHTNSAKKHAGACGQVDNLSSNAINIGAGCQEHNSEIVRKQCSVDLSPDLSVDCKVTDPSNPSSQKQNLGYFIVVHKDRNVLHSPDSMEDENLRQKLDENWNQGMNECASSCAAMQGNDDRTPDGMDELQWDAEVEDKGESGEAEEEDAWASLYRWYADILDRTSSLLQLPHRCDVNHQDVYGRCAVHYAAEQGHLDALHMLTEAGNGDFISYATK